MTDFQVVNTHHIRHLYHWQRFVPIALLHFCVTVLFGAADPLTSMILGIANHPTTRIYSATKRNASSILSGMHRLRVGIDRASRLNSSSGLNKNCVRIQTC